jgi:hypothetical protein
MQTLDSIKAIEQMWDCDLGAERDEWMDALSPLDSVTVAGTLLKLYEGSSSGHPTIEQLVEAAVAMGEEKLAALPEVDPWVPTPVLDDERGPFVYEVAPWVKGWAVARYRHQDFRVFPQQKVGYDSHQIANSGYRTYVWPDQLKMPPEDAERYTEEGAPLKVDEIFRMISQ